MQNVIVVFRARSETMNFAMLLKSYKIPCQIINTPRSINVSCGISVKVSSSFLNEVRQVLSRRKFDTFGGIYQISQNGLNQKVVRL